MVEGLPENRKDFLKVVKHKLRDEGYDVHPDVVDLIAGIALDQVSYVIERVAGPMRYLTAITKRKKGR